MSDVGRVGTGYVPIKPDTKGFGTELERGMDREGTAAAKRGGEKLSRAARGGFIAGAALIGKGVFDFAGFDKQMREVFTLLPDISEQAMGKMTAQVKDFSAEFGVLPKETVPALYQALSAGVPADNVFTFLETSQKLAKGGVTELETAVDGLSSVVNAYGADVISAEKASDLMFTTVKLGKTTIGDLSGALFNVIPTAAGLGVKFEDISAALAAMTSQGVPTSVATTQLRQALVELGKEGTKTAKVFEERAGKSFKDFIAGGGNLQNALEILGDEAFETDKSITDLFGSVEAGNAALSLTGKGAQRFFDDLQAMDDAAGATDKAFDKMNVGLSATIDRLKARFSVALINIGEAIAPSILVAGELVADLLDLFNLLPGPMQAAGVLFGTLTLGMIAFAKPILNAITLFGKLGKVFTLLAANPWVLVLAGLVAITFLIIEHWEKVKAFFEGLFMFLDTLFSGFTEDEGTRFELWALRVRDVIGAAFGAIQTTVSATFGAITTAAQAVQTTVSLVFGTITSTVSIAWSTVTAATSLAWSTVTGIVTSAGGAVVSFITGIPAAITGAFSTLASVISAPFIAAFGAIKATWNATVGGFGFEVPGWIPFVGGNSFTIPSMAAGGVLLAPQLFIGGDYPGARQNPEIVTPQRIMRETVVEALRETRTESAPARPFIINIAEMHVRKESDIEDVARALHRRQQREARAQGRPIVRTA